MRYFRELRALLAHLECPALRGIGSGREKYYASHGKPEPCTLRSRPVTAEKTFEQPAQKRTCTGASEGGYGAGWGLSSATSECSANPLCSAGDDAEACLKSANPLLQRSVARRPCHAATATLILVQTAACAHYCTQHARLRTKTNRYPQNIHATATNREHGKTSGGSVHLQACHSGGGTWACPRG